MTGPASIRRHPIHPMLIVFPIALWIFSFVCDLVYHLGSNNLFWKAAAFYTMIGGIIGALLAAVPGFIDYLSINERRAKQIATTHMVVNLIVVALFIFNLGLRYTGALDGELLPPVLSIVSIGLLGISGWLGGTLVYEYHVGVYEPEASRAERRPEDRRAA